MPLIALGSTQGCKRPCYLVTIRALVPIEPTARTPKEFFGIVTSSQWPEVGFDIIGHCLSKGSLNIHITILLETSVQF